MLKRCEVAKLVKKPFCLSLFSAIISHLENFRRKCCSVPPATLQSLVPDFSFDEFECFKPNICYHAENNEDILALSLSRYYLDMCIKRLCACVCECQCFCMFSAAGFAYCYNHNNCYLLWLLFHLLLLDAILLFCCCSNCRTFKCAPHTFSPIRPHIQNW